VPFIEIGNMMQIRGIVGMSIDFGIVSSTEENDQPAITPAVAVKRVHEVVEEEGTEKTLNITKKRKTRDEKPSSDEEDDDNEIFCRFCKRSFCAISTKKNHERFCEGELASFGIKTNLIFIPSH
jgi:hypothetical protein